jgi:hypothetical protein
MENVWWNGGIAPPFLTSSLDRGEWLASCLNGITLGERAPGYQWTEERYGEEKNLLTLPRIEARIFGRPARSY